VRAEPGQTETWSVSSLARALADTLFARFGVVTVQGEISGFTRAASGHCYFSLRDEAAQLKCVMFRQRAALVTFDVRDGQRVEVKAAVGIYEPRGDLQLTVESLRAAGQGALLEQFLRLKGKLQAEGLFDPARKRALPAHPHVVGIVTSPQAAALQDVLATLARRSPQVRVVIYPASVQGAGAALELARAVQTAGVRREVDVLLLVRGGGAMEDLWAFNDEALARALAASPIPVISGVGHETDFTIADFVADRRATTPTAAAELCAPAWAELRQQVASQARALQQAWQRRLAREQQTLDRLQLRLPTPQRMMHAAALHLRDVQARMQSIVRAVLAQRMQALEHASRQLAGLPVQGLARRQLQFAEIERRLSQAIGQRIHRDAGRLDGLRERLTLLDPAATLQRGYSLVWHAGGALVHEASEVQAGQELVLATAGSAARLAVRSAAIVEHPLAATRPTGPGESS
jgi:exodeoxyribonuclease VII large subunit